jgi:chaperonin cofactor prefoldin
MFFYSELISKFNVKCKENETLQKQKKKYDTLLKEYQSKLISAVRKQMPLEEVRNTFCMCWINI